MGKIKTILLKRPTDKNTVVPGTTTLQYGEPLFDAKNNQLYIGNAANASVSSLTPIGTSTNKTSLEDFNDSDYVSKNFVAQYVGDKLPLSPQYESVTVKISDNGGYIGGDHAYYDYTNGYYEFQLEPTILEITHIKYGNVLDVDLHIVATGVPHMIGELFDEACSPSSQDLSVEFETNGIVRFRATDDGGEGMFIKQGDIEITYNKLDKYVLTPDGESSSKWQAIEDVLSEVGGIHIHNDSNDHDIRIGIEFGKPPYIEITDPDGGTNGVEIRTKITATGVQVFENNVQIRNKTWKDIIPQ